jgi:aldose 1-epimerase
MNVHKKPFGALPDGSPVDLYTATNDNGLQLIVTNYGGTIVGIRTPDRNGRFDDICLGFDDFAGYLGPHPFFGALVGRFANRIALGRFTLNGVDYQVPVNNGRNALHGGVRGFDKRLWRANAFINDDGCGVLLAYAADDGEEGYPGMLSVTVSYTLTNANTLSIQYAAVADRDTVVNLTNHAYFNLNPASPHVYAHTFETPATHYAVADEELIPTGELASISGTPFDFSTPTPLGKNMHQSNTMLRGGRGFDLGFVVPGEAGAMNLAGRVVEPLCGRTLTVHTTEPDCHLYTGGFLDGTLSGRHSHPYAQHSGFCLETQHFPDSPNKPQFPSTVLKAGELRMSTTVFAFGTD